MKAIIIEDEELTAERLDKLVAQHTSIEVLEIIHSVKEAKAWLLQNPLPDLIFLDIQLGDGSGFDILESIETFPHIIFTTAFDQYAIEAFKYNSVDYLLKPIKENELRRAVQKLDKVSQSPDLDALIASLSTSKVTEYKTKFLIKVGLKYHSFQTSDIAYFYSEQGETYLCTKENRVNIIDHTLESLEQQLDPVLFFRVNRHMIVNAQQIETIDSYFNNRLLIQVAPTFPDPIIISRDRVKAFKKWMGE